MGASVVLDLIAEMPSQYDLTFDNYFTSLKLLDVLKRRGHFGTGAIRQNRVENAPLTDPKKIEKMKRGSYHQITNTSSGTTLICCNDNSLLTIASNRVGTNPVSRASHWSRKKENKGLQ